DAETDERNVRRERQRLHLSSLEQVLLARRRERRRRGDHAETGCSACPPNSFRIADRSWFANMASPRDSNRSYRAVLSTGTGTPSPTAARTVQRPSRESETRPEKPSRSGLCESACAVRSSSHDATTLPRRHTSATCATSMSNW